MRDSESLPGFGVRMKDLGSLPGSKVTPGIWGIQPRIWGKGEGQGVTPRIWGSLSESRAATRIQALSMIRCHS